MFSRSSSTSISVTRNAGTFGDAGSVSSRKCRRILGACGCKFWSRGLKILKLWLEAWENPRSAMFERVTSPVSVDDHHHTKTPCPQKGQGPKCPRRMSMAPASGHIADPRCGSLTASIGRIIKWVIPKTMVQ